MSPRSSDAVDRVGQEAERSVLGACLLHSDAVPDVSFLRQSDFAWPHHQKIYRAIRTTYAAIQLTDPTSVAAKMRPDDLAEVGGHERLIDLMEGVITAAGVADHARIVKEHAERRRLIATTRDVLERAEHGDHLGELRERLVQVTEREHAIGHPLEVLSLSDLDRLGDRKHLVDGVILEDSLTVLGGPPKSYKTTIGESLSIAIADGTEWLGRRVCTPGLVIDFALEGVSGKRARYMAQIGQERWLDPDDPVHRRLRLIRTMPDITSLTGQDEVLRTIEHVVKETGEDLRMLKLDTVARGLALCDRDENSTADMGAFIAGMDRIRTKFPSAQLGIHHEGKNGSLRGNSSLRGAYDLLMTSKPAGKFGAKLSFDEARDIECPPPYELTFASAVVGEDKHGKQVTAMRLASFVTSDCQDSSSIGHKSEQVVRNALDAVKDTGLTLPQLEAATGILRSTLVGVIKRMGDTIVREKDGKTFRYWLTLYHPSVEHVSSTANSTPSPTGVGVDVSPPLRGANSTHHGPTLET